MLSRKGSADSRTHNRHNHSNDDDDDAAASDDDDDDDDDNDNNSSSNSNDGATAVGYINFVMKTVALPAITVIAIRLVLIAKTMLLMFMMMVVIMMIMTRITVIMVVVLGSVKKARLHSDFNLYAMRRRICQSHLSEMLRGSFKKKGCSKGP